LYAVSVGVQVVVLYEELWTKESETERPKRNITLRGLGGVEKVRVQGLTGDSGTASITLTGLAKGRVMRARVFQCR